jgi:hypothetical protein
MSDKITRDKFSDWWSETAGMGANSSWQYMADRINEHVAEVVNGKLEQAAGLLPNFFDSDKILALGIFPTDSPPTPKPRKESDETQPRTRH